MRDTFKMVLVSLVTSTVVLFGLGETMLTLLPGPPASWGVVANVPSRAPNTGGPAGAESERKEIRYAPNLLGSSLQEARERWLLQGIVVLEFSQREDPGASPGLILEQIPSPGAVLQEPEIRVVVARAAEKISVPDLVGSSEEIARQALLDAGFAAGTPQRELDAQRDGIVLRQEPTAGTPAAKGTQIKLVVAEKGVLIPKLVGKRLTQAKSLLEKGGFHLGEVRTREHAEYSGGRILEQSPDAGAMVARGANVDLVVVAPD